MITNPNLGDGQAKTKLKFLICNHNQAIAQKTHSFGLNHIVGIIFGHQ